MIFGGLEIIAGGYLIHRHYRKKNEKEQLEEEAQHRRHNTFPGANPNAPKPNGWNTQAQHRPQHHQYPSQQSVVPQQKYPCYAAPAASQYQIFDQAPMHHDTRPQPPTHTQSFNIPRRPVPSPSSKPQIIIQPSLQRTDSFATLSRMPVANGSRPQDVPTYYVPDGRSPTSPAQGGLLPAPQHSVYGNAGFSHSTPAFGATPTSPPVTYTMATHGGQTVDDNWETYGHGHGVGNVGGLHYAPTISTQLGERDPPPPYVP